METIKHFNLIKRRDGERRGTDIATFSGYSIDDPVMLEDVVQYMKGWLDGYNNSLTYEEIDELLSDAVDDGRFGFRYDVWNFSLEEEEEEEEE